MSCKSCSTGGCGSVKNINGKETVAGCKSNGACGTGGCNKMNVFDWLSNMDVPPKMRYNVVEVKFKGGRKEYFRNTNNLDLYTGDFVAVEMPTGYHIGSVSLQGELVRLQMIKKSLQDNEDIRSILRKATEKEMEKHEQAVARDMPTMYRSREISKNLKLQMKLSDVEFQSDNSKAVFYYSAEDRVDFRELIKLLAGEFKIRIEMKQISLRQEAARVGGIGSCGRELCCSTWLTDFRNIPTSAARYQNLSLNPTKLSGQCGRLKCCLNYELETYMDALSDVPQVESRLKTVKGEAVLQKTDIFRKIMWFSYNNDSNWVSIPMQQVVEIQKMNAQNILPNALDDLLLPGDALEEKPQAINSDLDRLDKKYSNNKGKYRNQSEDRPFNKRPHNEKRTNNAPTGNTPTSAKPSGNTPVNVGNKTTNTPPNPVNVPPTKVVTANNPPKETPQNPNKQPHSANESRPNNNPNRPNNNNHGGNRHNKNRKNNNPNNNKLDKPQS